LQGEGRVTASLNGEITISDASLGGDLTLRQLFLLPVEGSWQGDIDLLQFDPGTCLPAQIHALQATIVMSDAVVLDYPFAKHHATLSRPRGQDLQIFIDGNNVSGEVVMNEVGDYQAQLSLQLPSQLANNPLLGNMARGYDVVQDGQIPCM
jgi:hypothetical protein